MKTLFKLFFKNAQYNFRWGAALAKAYIYGAIWLLAYMIFDNVVIIADAYIPAIILGTFMAIAVPYFMYRMLITHDAIAMDNYIKSRPIAQETWDRFVMLSQFFRMRNLYVPLLILPFASAILTIKTAILIGATAYLTCVMISIVVLIIKKESNYAEEASDIAISTKATQTDTNNAVSNMIWKATIRSKRIKMQVILLPLMIATQVYSRASITDELDTFMLVTLTMAVASVSMAVAQFGLAFEANYFPGIWTKPLPIKRILADRYRWLGIITIAPLLIIMPYIVYFDSLPIVGLVALVVYTIGFANLIILFDSFNCGKFDLMGNVFFNYQGNGSAWKLSRLLSLIIIVVVPIVLNSFFGIKWLFVAMIALGIVSFALRNRFFELEERRFKANRYKYMEEYTK